MTFWQKLFGITNNNPRQKRLGWKDNWKAIRKLPRFFKLIWATSPSLTLGNIILRLFKSVLPLATLYIGKLIIDEIISLIPFEEDKSLNQLWWYVGIEFGLILFSDLLSRGITLLDALLGDLFANNTSAKLIQKSAELDLPQFEDANFYDKLERARRQTTSRVALMSQMLNQAQDTISIVAFGVGLVVFNPWLILILIIAVIPSFLSENYFNRSGYSLARNWTPERRELDYLRFIGASDETAKEVKIFGLSDFISKRFEKLANQYYQANKKLSIKRAFWGSIFSALGSVGYYVAYIFIAWQTVSGQISIGDLTFLAGSFSQLSGSLQMILSRFSSMAQSALYLQDLFDFFDIEPQISSPKQPKTLHKVIKKGFTFENVGFKYPNTEIWAVRHISFHLKAGEKLALVGENGAGKTTLVKLLARLYDPNEGRILLDGEDIRDYDLIELRQLIGVIFQDYVRFQMTVSDNIAIGKIIEKENQDKIINSAEQSLADTVIDKLPEKYEQMLGRRFEKGVDLSGGQWQKIALGRAYMRDAQLLILDEPTAALDARAEYEVFERFSDLTKGKSAVLISHRFSTVRMADRIMVLKKGEMQEIGTHEELLASGQLYTELFNLQAEGYK